MPWFAILTGLWGLAMIAIFIAAIRLSYRIEARSPGLRNRSGLPRNAMMFHTVFNLSVARDPETQSMRRLMNRLLCANLLGFVMLGIYLAMTRGGA